MNKNLFKILVPLIILGIYFGFGGISRREFKFGQEGSVTWKADKSVPKEAVAHFDQAMEAFKGNRLADAETEREQKRAELGKDVVTHHI